MIFNNILFTREVVDTWQTTSGSTGCGVLLYIVSSGLHEHYLARGKHWNNWFSPDLNPIAAWMWRDKNWMVRCKVWQEKAKQTKVHMDWYSSGKMFKPDMDQHTHILYKQFHCRSFQNHSNLGEKLINKTYFPSIFSKPR